MKPESSIPPLPPQVEAWLSEQPDRDRRELEETWRLAERPSPPSPPSDLRRKCEVWAAVSDTTRRSDREAMPRPRHRLVASKGWRWAASAAVIAFFLGIAYLLRPVTIEAPLGDVAEAVLPDGSTVSLNSGSSLTYRAAFLGARRVTLDGEAYFAVVEEQDPFIVETVNAYTTVLGTQFNVWARADQGVSITRVVVAEGRVQVESRSGGEGVELDESQRSVVKAASVPTAPSAVHLERELAWRYGGLAFNDVPYRAIFAELERRYDVEIEAPVEILSTPFAIYLQSPDTAEDALSDITMASGLRYRETANGFEVYRP